MKNLIKLFFIQKKAKIRSLFSKPTSAIATILALLLFAAMFYPLFNTKDKEPMDLLSFSLFTLLVLAISTGLNILTLFQKKKALFFEEDSYFLFVGPFSNRKILSYLSFSTLFDSLILALISVVFSMMIIANLVSLPFIYILFAFLLITLYTYGILLLLQFFYIKDMIQAKKGSTQRWIGFIICGILIIYTGYSYFQGEFDFTKLFVNFTYTTDFDWIPILGWLKAAMFGLYQENIFITLLAITAFLLINSVFIVLLTHVKGYFYEQAMIDAVDFSDFYKKAMAGEDVSEKKLHDTTIQYKSLSGAIFSKNFLIMKKTHAFLSLQDFFSFIALTALSVLLNPDKYMFFGLLIFYLMNSVSNSTLTDDLKNNYIYLIPDKPIKKLYYSLLIPIVKTTIFTIMMILVGLFLVDITIVEIMIGLTLTLSFIPVFYAAVVLSIRVLKSRANKLVESGLRMIVILLIFLPSVGIAYLSFKFTGNLLQAVHTAVPILIIFNLLLSTLTFYFCSPMMNGNAYTAD